MLRLKDGFYAKDENGSIFMYDDLPFQELYEWVGPIYEQVDNIIIDEDWKDSLYKVKNGFINKIIIYVKDQKILVRDNNSSKWERRYYSHYEDGKHRVFNAGRNSWTEKNTISFDEIKPYIEGQDEM